MEAYAEFRGDRTVSAPLTWGQYAIWKAIVALAPGDAVLNVTRMLPVPDRADASVADVAKAVGALISRHESLRTRIRDLDGHPLQEVLGTGRIPLTVVECDRGEVPEVADTLLAELAQPCFDYAEGWPLRVGLVVAEGRVRRAALVASHAAVDAHAADVMLRDLRMLLLRGSIAQRPDLQPVDLAWREREMGERLTSRAIAYWLEQYSGLPESMFEQVFPGESPLYHKASLVSPAAEAAVRITATRHRVSTSTVLLAATAGLVATWTGQRACGLLTIAGNRLQPGHQGLVAPTNQLGLVAMRVEPQDTFADLLPRMWKAALQGYRNAYCDPVALNRALEAAGRAHDAETQPYCLFNDVRNNAEAAHATPPDETQVRAARHASTLTWPERFERFNWRFFLEVQDVPEALNLRLVADSRCLPSTEIERFLRALDSLLIDAALGDVRLAALERHAA